MLARQFFPSVTTSGLLWALLFAWAGLLVLTGCGGGNPYTLGSFDRGEFFYEKGAYHDAVLTLEAFVRQNPTDSLAARAQYLKAISYLELKEYPLAIVEFQILRKDFPTSGLIEVSYFQEGVTNFRQVGRVERDVSGIYTARQIFQRMLQLYPGTEYTGEIQDYLRRISDIIVRKGLNAADVYRHIGQRYAVKITLESLLESERASGLLDVVLFQLAENAEKIEEFEEAIQAYSRLVQAYPDSQFVRVSQKRLKRLTEASQP